MDNPKYPALTTVANFPLFPVLSITSTTATTMMRAIQQVKVAQPKLHVTRLRLEVSDAIFEIWFAAKEHSGPKRRIT